MFKNYNEKRSDLAQQTAAVQAFRRMKRGAAAAAGSPGKALALLFLLAAVLAVWMGRYAIFGYEAASPLSKPGNLLLGVSLAILAAVVLCALFWTWGGPWQAWWMQNNLRRIGFVNSAGEPPTLLSISPDKTNPKAKILEFYMIGFPVSAWMDAADQIQAALNITICEIRQGKDNYCVQIQAAPPASSLPTMLPWSDLYQSLEGFVLVMGESLLGPVTVDLSKVPHVLLGGSTGSGKSGLLRVLLRQALNKGAKVYIADFKGGAEFGPWWQERCVICYDMKKLVEILDHFVAVLETRKKLLREENCPNIDIYNCRGHRPLHRMVFACDEVAAALSRTGRSKEQLKSIDEVVDKLSLIAQQGRAFGLHLMLATQRPDANLIPGQIRSNIDCKVCGRADSVLSGIIIDSTAADLIPKSAQGRFILNDGIGGDSGTVFQAYWLDDDG